MSYIRDRFDRLNWRDLRRLGNSRLVKTSYFWVLFVPTIARWLEPFAGRHTVIFFGKEFANFSVDLPFSWRMLWWMSLFFVIGQGLYSWWCPAVVKQFSNYGDYRAAHAGPSRLRTLFRDALSTYTHADIMNAADRFREATDTSLLKPDDEARPVKAVRRSLEEWVFQLTTPTGMRQTDKGEHTIASDVFDTVLGFSSFVHRPWLVVSAVFLGTGFVLFVCLAIQTVCAGLPLILGLR